MAKSLGCGLCIHELDGTGFGLGLGLVLVREWVCSAIQALGMIICLLLSLVDGQCLSALAENMMDKTRQYDTMNLTTS